MSTAMIVNPDAGTTKLKAHPRFRDMQQKAQEINLVLLEPQVDLWKLRELALSDGGLVNDTLRRRAWPKLVGLFHSLDQVNDKTTYTSSYSSKRKEKSTLNSTTATSKTYADLLVESMDVEQIERDVARCTWHLLTGNQRSRRFQYHNKDQSKKVSASLKKKQRRLANLINLALVESYSQERLRYYQGYHDVACIVMHALGGHQSLALTPKEDPLGLDLASRVLCQISLHLLKDNLQNNFVSLQMALKVALFPLLKALDPQVHQQLQDADMEPFFCLSWVLTWFSHDVRDTQLCKRLLDVFLVSHPLMVVYMSLAMILHPFNRNLILQTDCDFAALHHALTNLPRHSCKVGWKKSRDGYISEDDDDEDDYDDDMDEDDIDDDQTTSTDMESVVAPSTTSSSFMNPLGTTTIEDSMPCKVPFQDLIDKALEYMARYPPRSLKTLAMAYYQNDPMLLDSCQDVSLLQEAPKWSLVSYAPADWVVKQRLRQEAGRSAMSRKDRRNHGARALTLKEDIALEHLSKEPDFEYMQRHAKDRAVIAVGFGLGPEGALRLQHQRRRWILSIAVGFVSMTIGLGLQYCYYYSATPALISSTSTSKTKTDFIRTLKNPTSASTTNIVATSASTNVELSISDSTQFPMSSWMSSSNNDSCSASLDAPSTSLAVKEQGRSHDDSKGIVPRIHLKQSKTSSLAQPQSKVDPPKRPPANIRPHQEQKKSIASLQPLERFDGSGNAAASWARHLLHFLLQPVRMLLLGGQRFWMNLQLLLKD